MKTNHVPFDGATMLQVSPPEYEPEPEPERHLGEHQSARLLPHCDCDIHIGASLAISPIFCYFFSRKYHFLSYFLSWAPPEKLKSKKKKCLLDSWTRACILLLFVYHSLYRDNLVAHP